MRRFLSVLVTLQCGCLAIADTLPLSGKDIVLMVRLGYSTEIILHDLNTKHFAGPLDPSSEAELRKLNASPELLDALKNGQFNATADQLAQAQQKIAAVKTRAEEFTEQQRVTPQAYETGKSIPTGEISAQDRVSTAKQGQEPPHAVNGAQIIDLEIGRPLDLRQFSGPNVSVVINGVEISELTITFRDYDRMIGWDHQPKVTHSRVKKEDKSLIYSWGRTKLLYLDVMDTAQNHVKLGIVSE